MALTLPSLPSLQLQPQRHSPELRSPICVLFSRKCRRFPCIHCSSGNGDSSINDDAGPAPQSWVQPDSGRGDKYAGWSFLDNSSKGNKLAGLVKVGAGIALAVGFAMVSHACSKRGLGNVFANALAPLERKEVYLPSEEKLTEELEVSKPMLEELGMTEFEAEEDVSEPHTDDPNPNLPQSDASSGQVSLPDENSKVEKVISESDGDTAATTFSDEERTSEELPQSVDSIPEKSFTDIQSETGDDVSSPDESTVDTAAEPVSDSNSRDDDDEGVVESAIEVSSDMLTAVSESENLIAFVDEAEFQLLETVSEELTVVHESTVAADPSAAAAAAADSSEKNVERVIGSEADELTSVSSVFEIVSPSLESEFWHFTSVGIPAPSSPSGVTIGRVVVPAVVDHAQEQALAVLQSLKIVEPGIEAGDICTRREYARWLLAANRTLARSAGSKILPAMYIEKVSELAFDDVLPNDPDFPFIQGLAEAGLIASRLSQKDDSADEVLFLPDSPVSRQDLVSWKLCLEQHSLPKLDYEALKAKSGFIDVDQIHEDAWPSIAADVLAGEKSIIASAFGYTRRFQAQKPVTKAQAAVALVSGDAALEQISEELARLEAEKVAERAVAAEIALEARAQKEVNAVFREELEREKEMTAAAEALVDRLQREVDELKFEKEREQYGLWREKAIVEATKESLAQSRGEVEELMRGVAEERTKVLFEKERIEKVLAEIEKERDKLSKLRSDVEVEKKALELARMWAEDEARKAHAHVKVLEEARRRWESEGIEVHVDKELDGSTIPVPTWQYSGVGEEEVDGGGGGDGGGFGVKGFGEEVKERWKRVVSEALSASKELQERVVRSMSEIGNRAREIEESGLVLVRKKAGNVVEFAGNLSSRLSDNSHKIADGCRGSAEKLAQIFKP